MNWLQRTAAAYLRRSVMPFVEAWMFGQDAAGWTASNRRFLDFSRDALNGNWVAGAALEQIALGFASVRLYLSSDEEEIDDDAMPSNLLPLYRLLIRPNADQAASEFFQNAILHKYLGGVTYLRLIGGAKQTYQTSYGPVEQGGTAPELWLLRPDYMTPVVTAGVLEGWKYDDGVTKQYFTRDDVLALRFPNPMNPWEGRSPLTSLALMIDTHTEQTRWNWNLSRNKMAPSGIGIIKGYQNFTNDKERQNLQNSIGDKHAGAINAGKPFWLPGESFDYKQTGINPVEADWAGSQGLGMRAICSGLGVPPKLLGDPETGTFANYQEARKAFYVDTILPQVVHMLGEFNHWLTPRYAKDGQDVEICYDVKHIDAMQESEDALYKRVNESSDMTLNDSRQAKGLAPYTGPEGEYLVMRRGEQLVDPKAGPTTQPQADVPTAGEAPGPDQPSKPEGKQRRPFALSERGKTPRHSVNTALLAKWRERYIQHVEPRLVRFDHALLAKADSSGAIDEFNSYLRHTYGLDGTRAMRADWNKAADRAEMLRLLDTKFAAMTLRLDTRPLMEDAWHESSAAAFQHDIGVTASWNLDSTEAQTLFGKRENLLSNVSNESYRQVADTICQQLYDGNGSAVTPDTLSKIQDTLGGISRSRAETIARTESGSVINAAQQTVWEGNGITGNTWNWSGVSREDHAAIDGEEAAIGELFSVECAYPCDPDGPPEQTINCSCYLTPVIDSNALADAIANGIDTGED